MFSRADRPHPTLKRRIVATALVILLSCGYFLPVLGDSSENDDPEDSDSPAAVTPPAPPGDPGESESDAAAEADEAQRYRLLPVPILITEPAIGEGLGVALALFHPVKEGKAGKGAGARVATPESIHEMSESREAPPVVTALVGAYTNNDTWAAGVGHFNNWRRDSIRYGGALAAARVNSQIYLANLPLKFSMESTMVFQEFKFRIGQSDFLVGSGILWLDADNRFGLGFPGNSDPRFGLEFKNVGVSARLLYETRNNTMSPTKGQLAELSLWRYDESIGGDFDYWSWKARALSFHPLSESLTLGLRLDVSGISGTPPFFAYPFVKLRGIPALRYQDEVAGAAEVEMRYLLAPRWEVAAFGGVGFTSDRVPLFENPDSIYNFGLGGRYKILDAHNVWLGIDVARGPEAWNWYVQIGHPW